MLVAIQSILLSKAVASASQFDIGVLSAITSFIACIGLCPLLILGHTRSIRPSDLVVIYVLSTLACDSAELGITVYENAASRISLPVVLPAMMNICVKLVLLVAESRGKESILRQPRLKWSPEQLAGILNRTFFWWINSILAQGRRDILTEDNLPPIDHKLSSRLLRHRALLAWDQRGKTTRI
jgi:ATP-binding cassette subfamily C (CFTR/MRP) protein 1